MTGIKVMFLDLKKEEHELGLTANIPDKKDSWLSLSQLSSN